MAFKDGSNNVINDDATLSQKSFRSASSTVLANTENKIYAADPGTQDHFGFSVGVGSGKIVIGSRFDDDNGSNSGSAYIFDLDGTQLTKITASDGALNDYFGHAVAVGSNRIVIGAVLEDAKGNNAGAAYIFDLSGTQLAKITASDGDATDHFGSSVAVGSGRIVIGANIDEPHGTYSGSVYIFDLDGNQLAKITASDGAAYDYFGNSVSAGSGRIVVGAPGDDDNGSSSGSAYIFDLDGNQLKKITASDGGSYDNFGWSVAVGSGRICVGAYKDADNGSDAGSAYIFDLDGNQLAKVIGTGVATGDHFGYSVAVGAGRIVVGAKDDTPNGPESGSAYIFDLDGNELDKITPSDGVIHYNFGNSVAVGSGRIVVGSFQDNEYGSYSGSAYIYDLGETFDTYIENIVKNK